MCVGRGASPVAKARPTFATEKPPPAQFQKLRMAGSEDKRAWIAKLSVYYGVQSYISAKFIVPIFIPSRCFPLGAKCRGKWRGARATTDGVDGIARRRRARLDTRSSSRLVHRATPRRAQTRWQVVRLLQRCFIGVSVEEQVEAQRQGREAHRQGGRRRGVGDHRGGPARDRRGGERAGTGRRPRVAPRPLRDVPLAQREHASGVRALRGCARRRGRGGGRDRPSRSRERSEGPHRRRVLLPHGRSVPPPRAARPVRARVRASVGVGPATKKTSQPPDPIRGASPRGGVVQGDQAVRGSPGALRQGRRSTRGGGGHGRRPVRHGEVSRVDGRLCRGGGVHTSRSRRRRVEPTGEARERLQGGGVQVRAMRRERRTRRQGTRGRHREQGQDVAVQEERGGGARDVGQVTRRARRTRRVRGEFRGVAGAKPAESRDVAELRAAVRGDGAGRPGAQGVRSRGGDLRRGRRRE